MFPYWKPTLSFGVVVVGTVALSSGLTAPIFFALWSLLLWVGFLVAIVFLLSRLIRGQIAGEYNSDKITLLAPHVNQVAALAQEETQGVLRHSNVRVTQDSGIKSISKTRVNATEEIGENMAAASQLAPSMHRPGAGLPN
jgi:hypothetical protein